jgi:arylsulfatase A-like enzyme
LISLDTLRADHLGLYGYSRATSPFLDELSSQGTLFQRAYTNTHGTPPSHASMFTGLYQETHRVSFKPRAAKERDDSLPDELVTLAEVLLANGYATVGVTGGGYMSSDFNFQQGFETFLDKPKAIDAAAHVFVDELRKLKESDDRRPVFAFFHTYEIHAPYAPPQALRTRFGEFDSEFEPTIENLVPLQDDASALSKDDILQIEALYDAGILHTDRVLRILFDSLGEIGFLENTTVLIVSDHGEEFREHGGLLHRVSLYEELVKVPLIILGKGAKAGAVRTELVSLIDVAPNIYELTRVESPSELPGRSLLGRGRGPDQVFMQYTDLQYATISDDWKLVWSADWEKLYDLSQDPAESSDLSEQNPEVVARLRAGLQSWRSSLPQLERAAPRAGVEDSKLEELRALGYIE